jgi:hypothetical protein
VCLANGQPCQDPLQCCNHTCPEGVCLP